MSFDDVLAAAERLTGRVEQTPVLTDSRIDEAAGAEVFLKAECLQTTGSFKFRGASNAIACLADEQRRSGVITYSSGNHAQAVAKAARLAGTDAVVVMPHDAPDLKVEATAGEGARLVRYDRYNEDRVEIAEAIAAAEGRTLIPPFDHYDVMAGQGTVGLELFDQVPGLDAVLVPVGGGGLLAGVATAAQRLAPMADVIGVEPEAGDDHRRSREAGERVDIGVPETIADGQQISSPGVLTWPITNRLAGRFVTATDAQIVDTMRLLHRHLDLVVEPSGACALAGLLFVGLSEAVAGRRVGVILSGGNVGQARFSELTGID